MPNISSKHHYLPVFYLKGFTDNAGKFYVYNYQWQEIKQGFPSMYFHEKDRNTIEYNNEKSDLTEQTYTTIDTRHARLFQQIQNQTTSFFFNVDQLVLLQEFLSQIFWRIPEYDEYYREQIRSNQLFTRAFTIRDINTNEEVNNEFTESIKNSDAFITAIRPLVAPMSMMAKKNDSPQNWRIASSPKDIHVCSDNPIIFRKNRPQDVFDSDFIFPLSKKHLLVRTFDTLKTQKIIPEFVFKVHVLLFKQGKSFCCGVDKNYLLSLKEFSEKFEFNELKEEVFSYLENAE